jgi:hypothetical protein
LVKITFSVTSMVTGSNVTTLPFRVLWTVFDRQAFR